MATAAIDEVYDSPTPVAAPTDAGGHPPRPGGRRWARGLVLSAGMLLSVSFLGAAQVRTASREGKPAATPAPVPRRLAAPATKPVSIQLTVLSSVTAESARAASPEVAVSVIPQPEAELAAWQGDMEGPELLQDVSSTPRTLASAAAAGRAPRRVAVMRMEVTAYCPCTKCCGADAHGVTASGRRVSHDGGKFVAADTTILKFGTLLEIPGYHNARPVEVIDRGGAIKGHKLDVYYPTHEEARLWGRRILNVYVVE